MIGIARKDGRQVMALTLLMAAASAFIGAEAENIRPRIVLTALIPIALIYGARQRWGSIAVAGLPFLLPDLPPRFGISGSLQLALLTTIIALLYWDTLGRPPVSRTALYGAVAFAVALFMLTLGKSIMTAEWICLVPFAGLVFGSCLAASQTARMALGFGCVPLALLAIAEVAGFNNPWPRLVHFAGFVGVDTFGNALRAQSTFGHPLIAGGCLGGMAMLMLQSRTRYCIPVTVVLTLGAVATVSRSTILGLGVALACSIVVSQRPGRHLVQMVLVIAAAYTVAIQVPALKQSINSRLGTGQLVSFSYTDQPVRAYALATVTHDVSARPVSLLLGGGAGSTGTMLTDIGGVDGYDIFDNQYATSIFDLGLLPMFVVGFFVARAIALAEPQSRRLGLPALCLIATVMYFVDGGYWLSLGWLAWVTVGVSAAPVADVPSGSGPVNVPARLQRLQRLLGFSAAQRPALGQRTPRIDSAR